MSTEEKKSKINYMLGEAVRDKTTGRKMYVDLTWSTEIPCVYFDELTNKLVKLEIPYDNLEKVEEVFPFKLVQG
ncbi:hypothetical protein [Leptospira interrogans]|uniref:hypothetical protein n=1 Tax=Leptospira interrogans TaxID=173 RepID=UPI0002978614|nr:hypothetical protein [Leptospira interrogans]EKR16660.1 hypothetical protein LEP1GSC019_0298 [Leptospira interrogans serovar Pyrogenes str. 2006006960]